MSHMAVLSFVQRNKIPRITQGRKVFYSKAHIDTLKGERESVDPHYYTYADVMEKYKFWPRTRFLTMSTTMGLTVTSKEDIRSSIVRSLTVSSRNVWKPTPWPRRWNEGGNSSG